MEEQSLVLDFFSRHTLLESVKIQLWSSTFSTDSIGDLVNKLLDACPNLRSIDMNQSSNWSSTGLNRSTFYKLAQSSIRALKINCGFHGIRHNVDVYNDSMKYLSFSRGGLITESHGSSSELNAFRQVCKTFRSLTHLRINHLPDAGLQCILYHLVS